MIGALLLSRVLSGDMEQSTMVRESLTIFRGSVCPLVPAESFPASWKAALESNVSVKCSQVSQNSRVPTVVRCIQASLPAVGTRHRFARADLFWTLACTRSTVAAPPSQLDPTAASCAGCVNARHSNKIDIGSKARARGGLSGSRPSQLHRTPGK